MNICYPFISNSTSMAAFDCFSVLQFRGGDALYVAPFVVIGRDKP
jgi:hypothetical protein